MLYLVDANVLIGAARDYYPLDRVPQFWEWLWDMGRNGALKIPLEVYEEVTAGDDNLVVWLKSNKSTMVLDESVDPGLLTRVVERGYAPDLTDSEMEKLGADPFIIAYALAARTNRCVVTMEASKPSSQRANRRIPDVCANFNIRRINTYQLIQELDFRIR